ncbi:glycosyltransferase family 2 protein [Clostridium colicanis]|uniref:N-glycosyltransferase n=1 Tax=Clostridium colicanis DSM 13634 TaxID=1121305 RepID=A0A151AK26_9CLOT|nr:glycosyltransferase family 2 protein [Clostridium colicanis]KYH27952.1 N-glycosyltransferase [Clostridium colicanis DSM 13634]
MKINFGVVIVTYNRKILLVEAIKSLLNQTYKVKKIVIIDNNSNDGTEDELKKEGLINNEIITYIRLDNNLGGSGGFYEGLKIIIDDNDLDWIALSDDDAIYDNKYFEVMSTYIKTNSKDNLAALTGKVIEHNEINTQHRRILINNLTFKQIPVKEENYKLNSFQYDVFSFVGCVINANYIKKAGLPIKEYFIWYDDTEYSLRIRKYGKIINLNDAIIYHKTPAINKNDNLLIYKPNWKEYYGLRNSQHMMLKHTNNKFITYIYLLIKNIKMIISTILKSKYKNYRKYRFEMIIDAYISAITGRIGFNKKYQP